MNVAAVARAHRTFGGIVACSALVALTGCARVQPDELSVELAKLRQELRAEMREGDRKVASDLDARVDGVEGRLTTLAGDLDRMGQEFDVTVERLEGAIRFNTPVFFDFADATVREADRPVLDRFAAVIKAHYPDALITVEGFADGAGSTSYNRRLGLSRAEAVIAYLASQGLDPDRLRSVSYGGERERLMDDDAGPGENGLRNRRVVLVIEGVAAPAVTTPAETGGDL